MAKGLNRERLKELGSLLSSVSHTHTCACTIMKCALMETDNILPMDTDTDGEKFWERHEALRVSITYEIKAVLIFLLLLFQIATNLATEKNMNVFSQSSVGQKYSQDFAWSGILSGGSGRKFVSIFIQGIGRI